MYEPGRGTFEAGQEPLKPGTEANWRQTLAQAAKLPLLQLNYGLVQSSRMLNEVCLSYSVLPLKDRCDSSLFGLGASRAQSLLSVASVLIDSESLYFSCFTKKPGNLNSTTLWITIDKMAPSGTTLIANAVDNYVANRRDYA